MTTYNNLIYFLASIGTLFIIYILFQIIWFLFKLAVPFPNFKKIYGQKCWVLVTGGSDGIGLGFCQQFAKMGYNICLIGRNQVKCKQVEIKLKYLNQKIQTRSIIVDFFNSQTKNFFQQIMAKIQDLDIGFLVNNVGMATICELHQQDYHSLLNQINVNIVPMTILTNLIISKMLLRNFKSGIINISSIAGKFPIPYLSTYSATKAYNSFFSKSLSIQYENKIDILSVLPVKVQSNSYRVSPKQQAIVISRNDCAISALKQLGKQIQTSGHWKHSLIILILNLLPEWLTRKMFRTQSKKNLYKKTKKN